MNDTHLLLQIHRLGDLVGVHLGYGKTLYLTATDALKLAGAMRACGVNIANDEKPAFASETFNFIAKV